MTTRLFIILALALSCGLAPLAGAQTPVDTQSQSAGSTRRDESAAALEGLVATIQSAEKDLAALKLELQKTKDELDRKKLSEQIARESAEIESLRVSFEMLATGVDLRLFDQQKDSGKFNWQSELEAVVQPIVAELKRLTERPRTIERLRTEQSYYHKRLPVADAALQSIAALKESTPSPELQKQFTALQERWQRRRDDLNNRLRLVSYELEETLNPSATAGPTVWETLNELIAGRGFNFLLAITAFGGTYFSLRLLSRLYEQAAARKWRVRRSVYSRFVTFLLHAVSVLLALLATMAVLYIRGDWLILGVLLLVLAGAAFTAKNSLPRYVNESRLLLNVGSVREGGRVMYNGLPWKVISLNVYSTLQNPLLRGGTLYLPLTEMTQLLSRRHADDEPWFPSRESDFVLLDDGTFGRVLAQTPELVQILTAGAVKTYPVQAYLEQKPKNLTQHNFVIAFKFGLDYEHQALITTDIRAQLEQYIEQRLRAEPVAEHLLDFSVQFDEAATSSLDLMIIAQFAGAGAENYLALRRLLQRLAVDACNAHQWKIPFNQLTVHVAAPDASLHAAKLATPSDPQLVA